MKIEDLPLPSIIIKALIDDGIILVEQLVKMSDQTLLTVPRLNKVGVKLIRKILELVLKKEYELRQETKLILEIKGMFSEHMNLIKHEINELRTITCEQYRLLQSIQLEKSPDGVLRKINDKVPGFGAAIHDLYKKLEE